MGTFSIFVINKVINQIKINWL
ncbi:TPA: erythromycin resistance leader peptide [Staphylococcus aureus]|nr:erythromycin resistance leader peptide [Staphylococcus aureus]HDC9280138.1 erythromycin resistance leader peptide [Staphylococcus aureus]